eukprot:622980-Hanusia_phi.AAC.1
MSSINKILQSAAPFRKEMWRRLGLPEDLELPQLDESHFHGAVSDVIHGLQGPTVYLGDWASERGKKFFQVICKKYGVFLQLYDKRTALVQVEMQIENPQSVGGSDEKLDHSTES